MTGFNARKKMVLEYVEGGGLVRSRDVARDQGIADITAREALLRLYRQGLLTREGGGFVPGQGSGYYRYGLTTKGRERLQFLRGQTTY